MTKAAQVNALHNKAMDLAGRAFKAELTGDSSEAQRLFCEAFEEERRAALLLVGDEDAEPTRSVLLRSAATLAVDCREFREAERLVALALSGNPPTELCEELRDVLESVYFSRHLALRGLELAPGEFQMSLTGGAIGFGVAESGQFLRRAETLEKLLVRTVERMRGITFRETGTPKRNDLAGFEIFYSAPRAASFALTIRLGRPQRQLPLPFEDVKGPNDVVAELLECMAQFNSEEIDALRQRIDSESYYNNFTALARKLAPDGRKIKTVGFTSIRGEETNEVALTRPPGTVWRGQADESRTVELVGRIRSADETSKRRNHPYFGVERDDGKTQNVTVPPGVLHDIVKPYWGERVKVLAVRNGRKRLEMLDIEPMETTEEPVDASS